MKDDFKNLFQNGLSKFQSGDFLGSEETFIYLLKKNPKKNELYTYLIPSLINQNKLKLAKTYSKVLYSLDSHYKEIALIYLGIISQKLKNFKDSATFFHESLEINPGNDQALLNLGVVYHNLDNNLKAIEYTIQSIKINKNNSIAYQNLASFLEDENRIDEAIHYLNIALSINDRDFNALHALSLLQLLKSDYANGYINYEQRFFSSYLKPKYTHINRLLLDSNIKGKKILVWHEQGLGDTIQFSRLVNKLVNLGGIVTLEVQKPLENFLIHQFKFEIVSEIKEQNFDYQIPLLSLLNFFQVNENNIPMYEKYFECNKDKFLFWKKKLSLSKDKINIGLSVSGNINHKKEYRRKISLEKFSKFTDKFRIFLIQKEISSEDKLIVDQNNDIIFLGADKDWSDFSDTSAIVENMDIIISIDSSLIHLSGAMNKKSYLLLSNPADWRWGQKNRDNTYWYDSVKLIRQKTPKIWDEVIEKLYSSLLNLKK